MLGTPPVDDNYCWLVWQLEKLPDQQLIALLLLRWLDAKPASVQHSLWQKAQQMRLGWHNVSMQLGFAQSNSVVWHSSCQAATPRKLTNWPARP